MIVKNLEIPRLKIIEPRLNNDLRGYFYEAFNQNEFNEKVENNITFVQDNHSLSKKGTIRGMHYQIDPFSQGKLVRVVRGEIYDVALNIDKNSKSYGMWTSVILSSENKKQFWIPSGFAHGFLALSDEAEVVYKTTNFYSKNHEAHIKYNDKRFNIHWPSVGVKYILSTKDLK